MEPDEGRRIPMDVGIGNAKPRLTQGAEFAQDFDFSYFPLI
jgi:hypothetical protein